MDLLFFIPVSLSYLFHLLLWQLSIHRLHLHSPILFPFPSSLLIYSLPIREYEPPPISSLSSLISFTSFFFFPFCSLSPLCSILESPIGVGLQVVGLCSILSRRLAIRCSQSRRFAVLSLKVSSIHRFFEDFIDSFYIYCIQVSSPSSL